MATERVEVSNGLTKAWMGRPGRADRLIWSADPGPIRPAGRAVHPVSGWPEPVAAEESDAVVRLFSDRVVCSWSGESAELPAVDEVEGLEAGLGWVAVWAAQVRLPIRTRVVWVLGWLIEVSPDGSYRKLLPTSRATPASAGPDEAVARAVPSAITVRGL